MEKSSVRLNYICTYVVSGFSVKCEAYLERNRKVINYRKFGSYVVYKCVLIEMGEVNTNLLQKYSQTK